MKKLLLVLLVLLALPLQAQEYSSRYFHYDSYFDAPPPFSILATTIDGADTQSFRWCAGGACDTTRGAYFQAWANDFGGAAAAGGGIVIDTGTGALNYFFLNQAGYRKISLAATTDVDDVDIVFGSATTAVPVFTVRAQTADGDDDGTLRITPGGAYATDKSRGVAIQLTGADATIPGQMSVYGKTFLSDGKAYIPATGIGGVTATATIIGTSNQFGAELTLIDARNDANPPTMFFAKTDSTDGSSSLVEDGDGLGALVFYGADGVNYDTGARITVEVDGTPSGGTDMPSRMIFSVSPDGSATPAEALRLSSTGQVLVKGVLVAALPVACTGGALMRATDSNDCVNSGGDGAMCVCNAAGNDWILQMNY